MSTTPTLVGFTDPVHDSQRTFRAALEAMARPGSIQQATPPQEQPPGFAPAGIALALALTDPDTPLWIDNDDSALGRYLQFHVGSPITSAPQAASFALVQAATLEQTWPFWPGDDVEPERSTTVIVSLAYFNVGDRWRLSGPGIATGCTLTCDGLPPSFANAWAACQQDLPEGIDMFLTAGDELVGLPRYTRIEAL